MIADRNNVRVFTSSTLRDMTLEREALVTRVFPRLREMSEKHGVALTDIDLRWGIADETVGHDPNLAIVKSELNRAAIMVSVLGERFGWIPQGEYDSVTALEMYTALASPAIRLLVFQRQSSLTRRLAADSEGSVYQLEPELEQKKLLRRLEHLGVNVTPYSTIEQFASEASEQILRVLEVAYFAKLGNVFISYSRKDIEKANDLKKLVEGLGFNVWLDLVGIAAGEEWPTKLAEAINECDVVLLLISRASVISDYCLKEIIFAKKKHKPIVGLRLDDNPLPDKVEFMLGDVQQIAVPDRGLATIAREIGDGLRKNIRR